MSRHTVTANHMEQLLDLVFHVMDQELRRRIMRELPLAYNDYVGAEIVAIVRTEDGSKLTPVAAAKPKAT